MHQSGDGDGVSKAIGNGIRLDAFSDRPCAVERHGHTLSPYRGG